MVEVRCVMEGVRCVMEGVRCVMEGGLSCKTH